MPLALAEAGLLGSFTTGFYNSGSMARLASALIPSTRRKLAQRYCSGIPNALVNPQWRIEILQKASTFFGDKTNRSWQWADRAISEAVARIARKEHSDLLLHEPYAWEAFNAEYAHCPRKVLFHFHLHPVFERNLLGQDSEMYPLRTGKWLQFDARPEFDARTVDLWRHADLILCASTFTKRSLVSQGMPSDRCRVVPYGIDVAAGAITAEPPSAFSVLFVGSGIQRKGLHHLLEAWKKASLPRNSTLTLVCRFLDPVLESMLASAPPSVKVLRGVSAAELKNLFKTSALFVMPSLLEGFGQVFLESLSYGCPVLGTENSCLPDLGCEEDGVFLAKTGDPENLRDKLENLHKAVTGEDSIPLRIRSFALAEKFSLQASRKNLVSALQAV